MNNSVVTKEYIESARIRFNKYVNKGDGCWEWVGAKHPGGYGWFSFNGKSEIASRVAYILEHGNIPDGLYICHKCDNPPCVNPSHLYAGTIKDNGRDMRLRKRSKWSKVKTCKKGHPFDTTRTGGIRQCRRCRNEYKREYFYKKRGRPVPDGPFSHSGENNPSAKLNSEKVREIRALINRGYSRAQLSQMFGVGKSTIQRIVSGKHWRNV